MLGFIWVSCTYVDLRDLIEACAILENPSAIWTTLDLISSPDVRGSRYFSTTVKV